MLTRLLLILLGSAYLVRFFGHLLCIKWCPVSVATRPPSFVHWCYFYLGACYLAAGCAGA
jgi:hypothetical protein